MQKNWCPVLFAMAIPKIVCQLFYNCNLVTNQQQPPSLIDSPILCFTPQLFTLDPTSRLKLMVQDGRSATITAPSGPAQQRCINASLQVGFPMEKSHKKNQRLAQEASAKGLDISMVEVHGTGLAPVELNELMSYRQEFTWTIHLTDR